MSMEISNRNPAGMSLEEITAELTEIALIVFAQLRCFTVEGIGLKIETGFDVPREKPVMFHAGATLHDNFEAALRWARKRAGLIILAAKIRGAVPDIDTREANMEMLLNAFDYLGKELNEIAAINFWEDNGTSAVTIKLGINSRIFRRKSGNLLECLRDGFLWTRPTFYTKLGLCACANPEDLRGFCEKCGGAVV